MTEATVCRPSRVGPFASFRHFMPGSPPDGCWDWTGSVDRNGYGYFECRAGSQRNIYRAHRVSWALFSDAAIPGSDVVVRHTCDRPICVQPAHLVIGTQADNMADMMARGRHVSNPPRGESSPNAKLTANDVQFIRASGLSLRELARIYGVSDQQISRIKKRQAWSWL